jgi:microcystin-dependent protein
MALLSLPPKLQFFDNNGLPLVGGKLYTYEAGTTTPKDTFLNETGNVYNTNPIILDSRGEALVWLGSGKYKFVLATAENVELWSVDNVSGAGSSGSSGSGSFETGMIVMWSGSIFSIPDGWAICDGTNDTPDLRNKFIVGAGSTYNIGATGGSANAVLVSHTHTATTTVTDPGHTHKTNFNNLNGKDFDYFNQGAGYISNIDSGTLTGSNTTGITVATSLSTEGASATNANLPPYYALAYIMKT